MSLMGNNTGHRGAARGHRGARRRQAPRGQVTVNGFEYRSTVGVMGGKSLIPFSSDKRAATGIQGGDPITVDVTLDTAPRTVELPEDLAAALAEAGPARRIRCPLAERPQGARHEHRVREGGRDARPPRAGGGGEAQSPRSELRVARSPGLVSTELCRQSCLSREEDARSPRERTVDTHGATVDRYATGVVVSIASRSGRRMKAQ